VLIEADEWIEAHHIAIDTGHNSGQPGSEIIEVHDPFQELDNDLPFIDIPEGGISLEEVERKLILIALERSDGNISMAARLLKINRGKLRYRLEKLKINPVHILAIKTNAIV
jgi:DNA-binding NtrC family response regulator